MYRMWNKLPFRVLNDCELVYVIELIYCTTDAWGCPYFLAYCVLCILYLCWLVNLTCLFCRRTLRTWPNWFFRCPRTSPLSSWTRSFLRSTITPQTKERNTCCWNSSKHPWKRKSSKWLNCLAGTVWPKRKETSVALLHEIFQCTGVIHDLC